MDFAQQRFEQWGKSQVIGAGPMEAITYYYNQQRQAWSNAAREGRTPPTDTSLIPADSCWSCRASVAAERENCGGCGAPVRGPAVEELRHWSFTCHEIKSHCDVGHLPLVQAHAAMSEAKSRVAALRNRLEQDRTSSAPKTTVKAAADSASPCESKNVAPHEPRRPLWEILLDPHTIQWLLGLGGVLLVVGLVIWLATLGIFKNPVVVAVALGAGNALLLAGGWATIRCSRYQTAGRAVTLLACLVMPLNLWFYHANNLITLDGNLWAAALACCVLYLASALVLRDHLFVYVLNGGVAMTGLLMLASAGRFWEIASPAALLVGLGLISIHVERAFPEIEGPFSRRRFGMAFFRSGHVLLDAGLLLVLGAQIAGDWLYRPVFEPLYRQWNATPPAIVEGWGQFLALALILAGTYAYFYSDIVVRRVGYYVYLAVFTLLWAEMLILEIMAIQNIAEAAIIALAATGLAANLLQPKLLRWYEPNDPNPRPEGFAAAAVSLIRAGQPLGLFLSTIPVLLGLTLHLRATYQPLNESWHLPGGGLYHVGWTYVLAMLATAVSCRVGAHLYRHAVPWLSGTYFFGAAAATLTGVMGLLSLSGVKTWNELAPAVMVVPILYMIAARLYRGHTQEKPLVLVAHAATGVMIAAVLAAAMHLTPKHVYEPLAGKPLNLWLAAFFAEASLFYVLAAAFRKQGVNIHLATAAACGTVWQLLQYQQVAAEYYTLTFALLGFALLIGYRLAVLEWTGLATAAFQCANALMSLSFVAAALMTLSRLATHPNGLHYSLVALLGGLAVLSLLAGWLVKDQAGRRWYIVMAITEAGLMFVTLHVLSHLTLWEKLEIFSVVIGIALLVIGHIGWHRERENQSDLVSFSLLFGSLLAGLPLLIAVLVHRCQPVPQFSTLNELGMLIVGIVLLATGFVLQLRSTTIVGACLLLVYLISLVLYISIPKNLQTAGVWLTVSGAVLFGTAIVLSIYRDRLLMLPEKARRREGIFRVLGWR